MKVFWKSRKDTSQDKGSGCVVQTAVSEYKTHPFSLLDCYSPLRKGEMELYSALREAVPIVDAAISKTVRLLGSFKIECRESRWQEAMDVFCKTVKVNGTSMGLDTFIAMYFDQLLTYGTAVGEMVLDAEGNIEYLYNASLKDVEIKKGESPLEAVICAGSGCSKEPVKHPELICMTSLNPEPGEVAGNSVLKGLPFVSSILLKIFNAIGTNWDRVGNVRFAVTYNPKNEGFNAETQAKQIAEEWSRAMRNKGEVCDFVAVGDISVKVIGADNQILDCDVPVKHILEQIVAKLGIPPFILGLSWSSTERMSQQQADILTSELEYYRKILEPVIMKIAGMWLRLNGSLSKISVVWDNISLLDEVELANARLINAQAMQIEESLTKAVNRSI